jgi:hypothetical protein
MIRPSWINPGLEVIVDNGGEKLIDTGDRDEFEVWLDFPADEKGQSSAYSSVIVYRGEGRIGRLGVKEGSIYGAILAEARHRDVIIVTRARREKMTDGSWNLSVAEPG